MKTPRRAVLALWALLAPSFAAAQPWNSVTESGEQWKSVNFTDENGEAKRYWFRSDASGDSVALYILTPKVNPAVSGAAYHESVTSEYVLKVSATWRSRASYVVTRPNTALALTGTLGPTLGASTWDSVNAPVYEERRSSRGTSKVRTNPYVAGSGKVVVVAPGSARESLAPTPMTYFVAGTSALSWRDFYFEREPATPPTRGSDPDAAYRRAKANFGHLHWRVLPFELILEPNTCFIRPETCTDRNNETVDKRYIQAGVEAAANGNLLLIQQLAAEGHADYRNRAQAFKASQAGASETEFKPQEMVLLQRLLATTGKTAAFTSELNASRAQPATLKSFVAKWRAYLTAEVDFYLRDSENVGKDEIDHVALRAAMTARAGMAPASAPTTAAASAARRGTPISLAGWTAWNAFEAAVPPAPGRPYNDGVVYCDLRGASPVFGNHLLGRTFNCVVIGRAPSEPAKVGGRFATGQAAYQASANPVSAALGQGGMLTMTLLEIPRVARTLVLTAPISTALAPYTSYVVGGDHLTAAARPAPAPDAPATALMLTAPELKWLTKKQQKDLENKAAAAPTDGAAREAALQGMVAEFRALVKAQIRPEAAAAYAAAYALPAAEAPAKILEAIGSVSMWGGDVGAIVTSSGTNLEIQLSPAEFAVLSSTQNAAALAAYTTDRLHSDGSPDASPNDAAQFSAEFYDPIQLHLVTEAARKVVVPVASAPANNPPAGPVLDPVNLTEAEKGFLSPKELLKYNGQLRAASAPNASPETKAALHKLNAELRALTKTRTLYAQPTDAASFAKLEDWQKERFCEGLPAPGAVIATDISTELTGSGRGALADVRQNAGTGTPPPAAAGGAAWSADESADACKKFKEQLAFNPSGGGTQQRGAAVAVVPGPDTVPEDKKPNPWLTKDILTSAAKGAMTGLLLGSLFGPAGLVLGPLIGGALFGFLTKIMG